LSLFDSDGIQDLVVTTIDAGFPTLVYRGNGDGSFGSGEIFFTTIAFSIAVGDFSGDGRPDIASVGRPSSPADALGADQ
jgi:hypothetical protein